MRRLAVVAVNLLAAGRSAEVHRIAEDRVVKAFHRDVSASMVEREHAAAALAGRLGVPTAAPLERGTWNGREAIHYPYVPGPSLLQELRRTPWRVLPLMRSLALLHAAVHRHDAGGALRSQHEVLATDITHGPMEGRVQKQLLRLLDALPRGTRLCHGDLHPGNVILAPAGPTIVDWSKASAGAPEADIVRTELLLRFVSLSPGRPDGIDTAARRFAARLYRHFHARAAGLDPRRLEPWYLPVAAAWMRAREGTPDDAMGRYLQQLLAHAGIDKGR